jgi:rhodanese-related sulfurtransferase
MKDFSPIQAFEYLRKTSDAVLIDCRSETEFLFVGHPTGAVHVAWQEGPGWEINPDFVAQVQAAADVSRPVVLICRSGTRSVSAALALEQAGYRNVYNVLEGFEGDRDESNHRGTTGGWRFHGLPWQQT